MGGPEARLRGHLSYLAQIHEQHSVDSYVARRLLSEGTFYPAPRRSRPWRVPKMPDQGGTWNAARRALEHDWTYHEGYALAHLDGFAMFRPHAWCLTDKGIVVETTWARPGIGYLGVPFEADYALATVGRFGSALRARWWADLIDGVQMTLPEGP